MIERGIVDGQEASLMYVNDAFTPVEKTYATMIVALLEDGRKIFLNVPMFRDAGGRIWNEELHSRVEGGQEAGQFGSGTGTPSEKTAAKGKRASQALARGKGKDNSVAAVYKRARAAGRTLAEQNEFEIAAGMRLPRDPSANVLSATEKRERNLLRQQAINARHLTAQGQEEIRAAAAGAKEMEAEAAKPAKKVATADDFTKADIPFRAESSEKFLQKWNDTIAMDPAEFKQKFTGGMQDLVDMRITLNGDEFHVNGIIRDDDGAKIGNFTRHVKPDTKEAYSAYFEIDKDAQKSDIGKSILGGNIETYEALGITKVSVTANIDVGGYAWAKYGYVPTQNSWNSLSAELEQKLDEISEGRGSRGGGGGEADDWNQLSEDAQDSTKRYWQNDARDDFVQSEISSWHDSGQPLEQAKVFMVEEFKDKSIPPAWVSDAIDKARARVEFEYEQLKRGETTIHHTNSEIYDALIMEDYESRYQDGRDDFEFSFDDDKLDNSETAQKPEVETLSNRLRDYITIEVSKAAERKAESDASDIEPPDFSDQVDDYMDEHWDQMSDDEKLRIAINYDQATLEGDEDEVDLSGEEGNPEVQELYDLVRESDPKNIWKVSDTSLGKKLLLNSGWSGVLDLKDPESYSRFKKYINKGRK